MSRAADERGAATVVATASLGVLLLVGAALGVCAAMVVDHRQAQSAADLAALAGAGAVMRGADGCTDARRVASSNATTLLSCRVEGGDVVVRVRADGPHWLGQVADLDGHARAGPG